MRNFKFRGKDCTGEWWYGNLEIRRRITDEKTYESIRISGIVNDNITSMIDAKTVGQFTGLHDVNGNDIYEGDILQYILSCDDEFINAKVKFSVENGAWILVNDDDHISEYFEYESGKNSEIIGNIHDNPELLKTEI